MNTRILYHKTGGPSARRLGDFMGVKAASKYDSDTERPDWLVRYGSGRAVPLKPSQGVINSRGAICALNGRLSQMEQMRECKVPVPNVWLTSGVVGNMFGGPKLGRKEGTNSQTTGGKDITFIPAGTPVSPKHGDFIVAFIPKQRQFRVHSLLGKTRVRELIPDSPELRELPVWNYDAGFTFRVPDSPVPSFLAPIATQAVASLNLDFGAVDIILCDGQPYVLEVNTAPGLSDATLEWYASTLAPFVGITEMPGWDAATKED